jgi:hypothetical protein
MLVADHLPRRGPGCGETKTVDHVIQTPLEGPQEVLPGQALLTGGLLESDAELTLENAIDPLCLLLLAKLGSILAGARPMLLVPLTGRVRSPFDRTSVTQAPSAFEEEFGAFPPTELA